MTTLYLDRRDTSLQIRGRHLRLLRDGSLQGSVPLALLERVVLRARVALDSAVLSKLAEHDVTLVVLAPRSGRYAGCQFGRASGDLQRRLAQYRCYCSQSQRSVFSHRLISAKLTAQQRFAQRALSARADLRQPLLRADRALGSALQRLAELPVQDTPLDSLRGIEGAAAAAYFAAIVRLFPAALGFDGRKRRPPPDPVNACLSLGYTLLHADAARALYGVGLDPMLGLYHEPVWNRDSLASDCIEPLRPHVDAWVWGLFRERRLRAEHFRRDGAACLLGKAGRQRFYPAWEQLARSLRRVLRLQAMQLVRELRTTPGAVTGREDG